MNEPASHDKPRFIPASFDDGEAASIALTAETIPAFLAWAASAPIAQRALIRRKIATVAGNASVVRALCDALLPLDDVDPVRHFVLLATIGETRNPVALPALSKLIWHARKSNGDGGPGHGCGCSDLSSTDLLGGLQARAVEMVAHIGGTDGDAIVFEVLARHPARAARIAAIDAYLFNHDDAEESRELLRSRAAPGDRKFIGLPRFTRHVDRQAFDAQVERFYRDHPDERPPMPASPVPRARSDAWHANAPRRDSGPQA